jgi:anaerobic magnesium-protoporphyrin IX monomethyl ester cyclase
MKILLVNPPSRHRSHEALVVPPLGLAYLAAVARREGHYVSILDAFAEGLDWKSFASRVGNQKYDIIGITGMTPVFDTVKRSIKICRPHARYLVLGGPHATAFRDTVMRDNLELDFAIYGEGERTFLELLAQLEDGDAVQDTHGIVTRDGVGPPRALWQDLDTLPFPARDLLPNDQYRYPLFGTRSTTLITSRGCPFPCIFCDKGIFGNRWRARSADNILGEVDEAVFKYGAKAIVFYDDLFLLERRRVEAVCEGLLRRKYRIRWKAEARVDCVDKEILTLMRRAGCDVVAYGVETGNQVGLDYLEKKTNPDRIRLAFEMTRKAGIKTMGYFILGIPVETYNDALNTIQFAIELKTDYAQFSVLSPLPGTRLYDEAVRDGWYTEIAAHNISDKDLLRPVVRSPNWDEQKLISIIREAHHKFYMRPSYILKSLSNVRSLRDLGDQMKIGMKMLKYLWRRSD